jgi:hypothetical protein
VHIFQIPDHLLRDSDKIERGLHLYYKKYKACLSALSLSESMASAGKWAIRKPSDTEVVELFIGKTMWHDKLKKTFSRVSKYPEMLKWLNEEEDGLPDIDVWGEEKTLFTFKDLKSWLDDKDMTVKRRMDKGKAREEEKMEKKKKKKKRQEEDKEEGSSRKHCTRSKGKNL